MKRSIICIVLSILVLGSVYARDVSLSRQVQNLTAFTKLCGYVKHFYPSDEAQNIPWAKFQAYGSEKVINAKDNDELRKILLELFSPIVPPLQLYTKAKAEVFDPSILIPENPDDYCTTFWQYRGLNLYPGSPYQSICTRRPRQIPVNKEKPYQEAVTNLVLPHLDASFSKARISFSLMKPASDSLKVSYAVCRGPQAVNDSLKVSGWQRRTYLLEEIQDQDHDCILYFSDFETIFLDSLKFEIMLDGAWQTIYDNDFSDSMLGTPPKHLNTNCMRTSSYTTANTDQFVESINGNMVLAIRKAAPDAKSTVAFLNKIFEEESQIGELVDEPLIKGLSCRFPLALYSNYLHTYPPSDTLELRLLMNELQPIDLMDKTNIYPRLGGLITYWNHQHFFYPYWQYSHVNWERELPLTIKKILVDNDFEKYKYTLRELISKIGDGHATLNSKDEHYLIPGFNVQKVEKRWIVTQVADSTLVVPPGSEVLRINGQPFARYMKSNRKYYSKASDHGTDSFLFLSLMLSHPDSTAVFSFKTPKGKSITQDISFGNYYAALNTGCPYKTTHYSGDIMYVNVSLINDSEFEQLIPELSQARGIIFDIRDYPGIWNKFIAHLLKEPDHVKTMYKKCYLYPRQELPQNKQIKLSDWYLQPAEPHFGGKAVFLCGASSLSRPESFLQNIRYNQLGTIIGQPTAGTTGEVIGTSVPGGLVLWWTGMFVSNPDGSRFHGVGVIPDIYVKPTIKAYAEGRDAELEQALVYLQAELKLEHAPMPVE